MQTMAATKQKAQDKNEMITTMNNRHLNNSSDAAKFLADVEELWNHMKNKKSVVDGFTLHLDANIPIDWLKNLKLIFTSN
jgi:hypothetical protein